MSIQGSLLGFFMSVVVVSSVKWTANNRAVHIAEQYVGLTENLGPNRNELIDKWNTAVGVPVGSSYCAAFISFVLDSADAKVPAVRSALAQHFITKESIKAVDVLSGREVPAGTLVIWKKGQTWMGHIGITTEKWKGSTGHTIEANTSPSVAGDQRNGDGVWKKTRRIDPTAYFRITHFTVVQ